MIAEAAGPNKPAAPIAVNLILALYRRLSELLNGGAHEQFGIAAVHTSHILRYMTLSDSDHAQQQFVKVFQFRDLGEALVIKGLLESSGIKCLLGDENTVRMDWFWSNAIGGVKLWVRAEDEGAARSLLQSASEKIDAPKDQIPKPGASHRYASRFAFTGLLVGILVLSSSYFFYTRPNRKMPDGLAAVFSIICPAAVEEAMLEREHYIPVGANWFFISLQNAMVYGLVGFALGHAIQTRRDTATHADL